MTELSSQPPVHELLAHTAWLRRLAGQLVSDRSVVEDVVQETWVSALRGPRPRGEGVRPWLGRVLRNVLYQHHRRESARLAREARVEGRAEVPGAGTVVERTQSQQLLVEAVLALDEPLRSTVLLRYFDGLSSAAIARRLGVPASTVRNRLRTALAELRGRLAARRSDWLGAMASLARVPTAGPLPLLASILSMGIQAKLAVAAVLAATLVVVLWPDGDRALQPEEDLVHDPAIGRLDAAVRERTEDTETRTALAGVESDLASAPADAGVTVHVLDEQSRAPIPRAVLHWAGEEGLRRAREARPELNESAVEELLHRVAAPLTADATGVVRVPGKTRLICARSGDAFGFSRLDRQEPGPVELLLSADSDLRIEVIDDLGAPRGDIPVSIEATGRRDGRRENVGYWRDRTGSPEGSATLKHWPAHLSSWEPVEHLIVRLECPGAPSEGRPITRAELDERFVRLSMHGTGTLEFVLPEDVAPSSVEGIELHGLDARGEHFSSWVPGPYQRRNRLEQVALGLTLSARARSGYEDIARARGIRGPQHAGEVVTVPMEVGSLAPVLVGRLVDPEGRPLPGTELEDCFEYHLGERRFGYWGIVETDASGRFRSPLPHHQTFYRGWFILLDAGHGRRARVEIPVGLGPGDHELGDVVLALPPILARGVVVDAEGHGVGGASVRAWPADGSPPMSWAPRGLTDPTGRFQLRSPLPQEEFQLVANHQGRRARSPVLAPAAADVVLVMAEEGAISLQILTDDRRLLRALRVSASLDREASHWWPQGEVGDDGTVLLEHLQPGLWRLRLELEGYREPIHEERRIPVASGETARESRLVIIDLRARFTPLEMTVVEAEGLPLAAGRLAFRNSGESSWRDVAFEHGRAMLFATRLPLEVEAEAPGFRKRALEGVEEPRTLVLERGMEVQLALPSEVVLPDPPTFLEIELRPSGDADPDPRPGEGPNALRGRFLSHALTLRIGDPGRYVLRWRLIEVGDFDPQGASLEAAGELQLLFEAGERGVQVLPVARERLERAIAELRGR